MDQTLTLQDIADLAKVRRPVVSMWRKRPRVAGGILPFPTAVDVVDGMEHFDPVDVADYLRRSGRGNNPEFALDAPAATVPDNVDLEELVTLLCLRTALDEELSVAGEKDQIAAAYQVDPEDRFLVREVLDLRPEPATLAYVDDLYAASLGAGEALDRLEQSRLARRLGARGLSAVAIDAVGRVAEACAQQGAAGGELSLSYAGGDVDLAASVARRAARLWVPETDRDARSLLRRATIRGVEHAPHEPSAVVRVGSLVGLPDPEALAALDEVVLGLAAGQYAVMIGAASALCDAATGAVEQRRSRILRSRSLVCALRMPRGQWRGAHRQALAIVVWAGATQVTRPMVADLEAFGSDEVELDDLANDAAAALAAASSGALDLRPDEAFRSLGIRAFRYLRLRQLESVQGGQPVVPRGARAERLGSTTTSHRDRVIAHSLVTSAPPSAFDLAVADAPAAILLRPTSLGDLVERGLKVRRGSRIDLSAGEESGSVEVWSAQGPTGARLDPIDAEQRHPRAQRTEPGDVIFAAKPRPHAVVDPRGGALVASPSRILRATDEASLGPYTLAAAINLLPETVGDWQAWPMPSLRAAHADALEAALREAAAYESDLRCRLEAATELQRDLIAGVAAGAITVESHDSNAHHIEETG